MPSSGTALSRFLRACREQVAPEEVGLTRGPRRRAAGLRRQEVAQLAGVSVEYLARLEQGRAGRPSVAVLDAIADALRLDPVRHQHLRELGGHATRDGLDRPGASDSLSPRTRRLLELVEPMPAMVVGRHMDLLAVNRPAAELLGEPEDLPPAHRNIVRRLFRDPAQRRVHPEWAAVAAEAVAALRGRAARDMDDPHLQALVADLQTEPEFAALWAGSDVGEHGSGTKRLDHPHIGPVELTFQSLEIIERPGQMFVLYTAEPGSPSADAILELGRSGTPAPGRHA